MVAPSGTNAPGINGYDVTVGQGQLIKNVAISAEEQFFRVVESSNTEWTSATPSTRYTKADSKTSFGKTFTNDSDDIMTVTGKVVADGNELDFVDEAVTTSFFYEDVKFAIDDY